MHEQRLRAGGRTTAYIYYLNYGMSGSLLGMSPTSRDWCSQNRTSEDMTTHYHLGVFDQRLVVATDLAVRLSTL